MPKVGVVGLGVMGQNHVRIYSELGCDLVGVADIDSVKGQDIARKYKTKYYCDYADLIAQVDAVSIVVPTTLHKQVAVDFMKRGVHCLVEKPIASTVEEAEEMVRTAEENHVKLMVGHIERFNPAVQKLKQIIDEGTLGQLIMISTRRVGPFAYRIRDVGVIIDSATHDIDVARYLVGREPRSVFSRSGRFKHEKHEDHAIIVLDFEEVTTSIEVNWFTPHKVRSLVATGSKAIAFLDYIEQQVTVDTADGVLALKIDKAEPLKLELVQFLECISNGQKPLVDGYEGLNNLKIALEACKRSADSLVSSGA